MTYKKLLNIVSISLFLSSNILFLSCDSILNQDPLDKVTDEIIWGDLALMDAYTIQTYESIQAPSKNYYYYSTLSDESFARERTDAHLIQRGDLSPSNMGYLKNEWSDYYKTIFRCNIFLNNVQSIDLDELTADDKRKLEILVGENKFIRARSYFRLATLFGGVPLITEPVSIEDSSEKMNIKRTSYESIIEFIVNELDAAAELLPLQRTNIDMGRLTKGAAMAIKAKTLLFSASPLNNPANDLQKWELAANAAKNVIDLDIYKLYPDYGGLFREEGDFCEEMIWERVVNNSNIEMTGFERDFFPNGFGGFATCVPTQQQVEAYETTKGLYIEDDPDYKFELFWENRDPRFYETILYNGAPFRGRTVELFMPDGEDSFGGPTAGWNASYTGYYNRKFVNEFIEGTPGGPGGVTSSPNWPYLRYAEILLIYAEAKYNLGDEESARKYLNLVRSRPSVDMPEITDSGENLIKRIENEYSVEFYLEEKRFFNIRRWKKEYPDKDFILKMNYEINPSTGEIDLFLSNVTEWALPERTYHLPIPRDEINRNPNLEQNPGY